MWIMDMWRAWSQKQYDKWGSKLQGQYDEIKGWTDEDLKKTFKALWDITPTTVQKSLTQFIVDIYKKYGEEFAKKIIDKLLPNFKEKK